MSIRILLANDHHVVRFGLRLLLQTDPQLQIVGEAVGGEEAVKLALKLEPDVVLMDLIMPGMNGFEATTAIRRHLPQTQVLILTSLLEDRAAARAVEAGAIGYLPKNGQVEELITAIKEVANGQVHLPNAVLAELVHNVQLPLTAQEPTDSSDRLTSRELEVLELVVHGYINKSIANTLGVGEGTIKTHVSNILKKLQVETRSQAMFRAIELGLVDTPSQTQAPVPAFLRHDSTDKLAWVG